ncbi:hypothetical protein O0I10_002422 [Lichtheimia ornata]|uniref:Type 1 phosphatases regulator n=1 Tax=Lichtheimia ornata TaxID=688661 RepID=A0AAD7V9X9_9FUNG|nr:uncharacterized protein O0I10_002422 [Lichtheimia ornata]KAJ8661615.1 hypothetical protein O0I10_002422 [Lichtheimia ornata]
MPERTSSPSHGSRTMTIDPAQEDYADENTDSGEDDVGILRLRGDMSARRPRAIQWDESVVDNEHMNKKKSKICCIYHRPRAVGESSDEESSSDSSSSSSDSSDSDNDHSDHCDHHHHHHRHQSKKKKKKRNPREASPNAYERQPVYKDRR